MESFKLCLAFPAKWFGIRRPNLTFSSNCHLIIEPIFNHSEDSIEAYGRLQNKFIGNSSIGRNFLKSSKVCLAFQEKWFCIRQPNLAFSSLEPIFYGPEISILGFGRIQNKFIGNFIIERKFLESFKLCVTLPEKWFCIRRPNLTF